MHCSTTLNKGSVLIRPAVTLHIRESLTLCNKATPRSVSMTTAALHRKEKEESTEGSSETATQMHTQFKRLKTMIWSFDLGLKSFFLEHIP